MTTPKPTPEAVEALARLFHDEYERAAVGHGWETQERSRVPWEDVPEANKATMLTTCRAVLAAGYVSPVGLEEVVEDLHGALDDYGNAVGDLNLANYRLARVEAEYATLRDESHDLSMALGRERHTVNAALRAENERLRAQVARAEALADEWGRTPENVKCYGLDRAHGERLRSVLDKTCSCTNDFGVLGADCGGTYCS